MFFAEVVNSNVRTFYSKFIFSSNNLFLIKTLTFKKLFLEKVQNKPNRKPSLLKIL